MLSKFTVRHKGQSAKTKVYVKCGKAKKFIDRHKQAYIVADKVISENFPTMLPKDRLFTVEGGEALKSIDKLGELLGFLAVNKVRKDDMLIAVGGGTVGDLAGLGASLYMRGIQFANIPTTLLAMADSALGGKSAVNYAGVKNLVGIIRQPQYIVADPSFLVSLSEGDFLSGFGEIIKHGFIADEALVKLILKKKQAILSRDADVLENLVGRSLSCKAAVTVKDELESGVRILLNAGHTVGHAIESDSKGVVAHGAAVATGLYLESIIGKYMGYVQDAVCEQLEEVLSGYGFPLSYSPQDLDKFFSFLKFDKKVRKDHIKMPFIKKTGKAKVVTVDPDKFEEALKIML